MSNAILKGGNSGTGSMTIQAPNTNGSPVVTLPDASGVVQISGNMPAFSATSSVSTTVSNATFTKIAFQSKEFDTNNYYDSATNYRFTPLIAGYYQVSGVVSTAAPSGVSLTTIYKNGSRFKDGNVFANSLVNGGESQVSALVYFNGSTDYIELWFYQGSGTSQTTQITVYSAYFQAALIRAA